MKFNVFFVLVALFSLFSLCVPALAKNDLTALIQKAQTQPKVRIIVRVDERAMQLRPKQSLKGLCVAQAGLAQIFSGLSYFDPIAQTDLRVMEVDLNQLKAIAKHPLILNIYEDGLSKPFGGLAVPSAPAIGDDSQNIHSIE